MMANKPQKLDDTLLQSAQRDAAERRRLLQLGKVAVTPRAPDTTARERSFEEAQFQANSAHAKRA